MRLRALLVACVFLVGIIGFTVGPASAITPRISANPSPVTLAEGESRVVTIALDEPIITADPNAPSPQLTLPLTSPSPSRVSLSASSVDWDSSEWAQTRTFTITAATNAVQGDSASFTLHSVAVSSSEYYSGFAVSITVNVTDATPGDTTTTTSAPPETSTTAPPAATPDDAGYRLAAADGGVFAFGGDEFYGSAKTLALDAPITDMASTPDDAGYWLVALDGGVFAYGDAQFFGSAKHLDLQAPIVGIAPTPTGRGYWLVGAAGGVFAYGDAQFFGSARTLALQQDAAGIAATPTGNGYLIAAADGGVFAYGDAGFFGSAVATTQRNIVGIQTTSNGYRLANGDGAVFAYGDAQFFGPAHVPESSGMVVGIRGTATASPGPTAPCTATATRNLRARNPTRSTHRSSPSTR